MTDLREVTKDEFFAKMNPLNVHPRPERDASHWEMQDGSRRLVGKSVPGYLCDGPKRWFLVGVV